MIIKYHKEHRAHKRRTLYDSASTTNIKPRPIKGVCVNNLLMT